jgi:protein-tyrosine-phosphatase
MPKAQFATLAVGYALATFVGVQNQRPISTAARSIMAEAILNNVCAGKFRAYSAGSHPKGRVHPETLRLLQSLGYDTSDCRSKSWDEFTSSAEQPFDFVFTVCDNAAAEVCPLWPGQPMTRIGAFLIPSQPLARRAC